MNSKEFYELNANKIAKRTPPEKRVYCKNCRFLRQQVHDGKLVCVVSPFQSSEQPLYACVAPDNIAADINWFGRGPLRTLQQPHMRNHNLNCPVYETVEDAVTVKTPDNPLPVDHQSTNEHKHVQ